MNIAIILITIGAILIIMAIIGYVAEKNGLVKKKEEKSQEQIPEVSVNESNLGAETWSENAKPKDEHQETIHKVPTMDDWSSIPTDGLPKTENLTASEKVDNTQDEPMFPEINSTDLEIPEVEVPTMENIEDSNESLTMEEVTSPIEESNQTVSEPQNMNYSFDFSNQVAATPVETLTTKPETTEVLSAEPTIETRVEPAAPTPTEVVDTPIEPLAQEPNVELPAQPSIENVSEPEVKTEIPTIEPVSIEQSTSIGEPQEINESQQGAQTETSIWN